MRKPIVLLAVSAAVACPAPHAATAAAKPPALPGPGSFAGRIDNPWFPLTPGTVLVYEGEEDGEPVRDVLKVTHRTKTIEGVRTTVIDDRVYLRGRLEERTTDWYAQDKAGNVWYLGEDTATLDANGKVDSTDGTWRAGVDGGRAGIFMPAHPRAGQAGLQEYSKGEAEDAFEILHLAVGVRTPAVSSHHAMLVRETTRLEPGVVDHKIYVRGVGTVLEETVKGGDERLALVSVRRP